MNKTVTADGSNPNIVYVPENLPSLSEYYILYRIGGWTDKQAIQLVKGLSESSLYKKQAPKEEAK